MPAKPLLRLGIVSFLVLFSVLAAQAQHFNGAKALDYTREFVSIGPRWPTSPGHAKAEAFLRSHFQSNHDQFEEDAFFANTPIGPVTMRNFIVRFPGAKPGVIVLATHYETNYPLSNINFVGANDGGSTTGLLLAIADHAPRAGRPIPRQKTPRLLGLAALLRWRRAVFQTWSQLRCAFGSRHLASKWGQRRNP